MSNTIIRLRMVFDKDIVGYKKDQAIEFSNNEFTTLIIEGPLMPNAKLVRVPLDSFHIEIIENKLNEGTLIVSYRRRIK